MAAAAMAAGVPAESLILDEEGDSTQSSARNCGEICRENGFRKLLVVSQYFHNARVKLIFEREGTPCFTVPAHYRELVRERYFLLRETIAFLSYLFRPGSAA
jgi:vancomycin permeability regulator SanA